MTPPSSSLSCLGNGQSVPPETALHLTAGPLQVDLIEGELRYLTAGPDEAVRRIYAAVRDGSWNTIAARRSAPVVVQTADGFSVTWQNEHVDGDVDFTWESRLTGTADGVIRWEFDGVARRAFAKNRVGFCILHPLATCQGKPCQVEHVSGDIADRTFPDLIDPQQPVRGLHDFRRIRYAVNAAWDVSLELEGDAFEMEDQRNWTDASFKTYSTPQRIPLPARLTEGRTVRQVVTVRLIATQTAPAKTAGDSGATTISLTGNNTLPWPHLGLGSPTHDSPMSDREIACLRALKLDHLRVDVKTTQPDWRAVLSQGAAEAARLSVKLEVALHLADLASGPAAATEALALAGPVARWLVLEEGKPVVSPALLLAIRPVLGTHVGAGTDIDFFVLNNNRPAAASADFIFSSIRPQAHAFDDASIIENLAGQTHLTASARAVFAPLPFVASPVTLKRRWHKGTPRPASELPPMVDRRQLSLLGAGWLTGSLHALTEAGAASVTWFETTGWRGVMETAAGAPLPDQFPSTPGAVFPMYHVLRAVADFRQGGLRPIQISHPLLIQAAVLESGPRQHWIIANVTGLPQQIILPVNGDLRLLDEAAAARSAREPETFAASTPVPFNAGPLELAPWSLAFLDAASGSLS
jgi:D-apionolactonase